MAIYVLDRAAAEDRRDWANMGFGGIVIEVEGGKLTRAVRARDVIVAHRFDATDMKALVPNEETAIVVVRAYERTPSTHSCGYIYTRGDATLVQESVPDFTRRLLDFTEHFARTGERDWLRLERLHVPDALLAYRLYSVDPRRYSKQLSELREQAVKEARALAKDPNLDPSIIDVADQVRHILAESA